MGAIVTQSLAGSNVLPSGLPTPATNQTSVIISGSFNSGDTIFTPTLGKTLYITAISCSNYGGSAGTFVMTNLGTSVQLFAGALNTLSNILITGGVQKAVFGDGSQYIGCLHTLGTNKLNVTIWGYQQ